MSFNPYWGHIYIVKMTCLPKEADTDRTVLNTVSVNISDGWWTGLVRDRAPQSGETRLRLERWSKNGRSYDNPHNWRVRRDFWDEECEAVSNFQKFGGDPPPGTLPIDQYLSPIEYRRVRKDEDRWVAVVQIDRPYKSRCTRLYHWDPLDGSVRQKWTIGRDWSQLKNLASRHLKNLAVA